MSAKTQIIFSDFDGTLTDGDLLGPVFFDVLNECNRLGLPLVIVSGRALSWGHFLLTHLPLSFAIMEGGGVVIEKKNKDLIKKLFVHLIKDNNFNQVLNYIYSVADSMWKYSNDRSVDFNYYTKRLILSSVYLKILILSFYKDNFTQKNLEEEIKKSLEHVNLISQFKIKLDFLKNIKEFFSFFSIQKTSRGF